MHKIIQLVLLYGIITNYQVNCGTASCSYKFSKSKDYICTITLTPSDEEIYNKSIPENYDVITGTHNGGTDDTVTALGGSGTNSRTFPGNFCVKFKNLKKIQFAFSTIEKITKSSLESCENLEIVNFINTEIKWIGQESLVKLEKLEKLTIGSSKLRHISEILLKMNKNLKELRLSSNLLSLFSEKTLENQEKLKILVLSYNNIEGFPKNFFKSLKNLEILDLKSNSLANISGVWFDTLTNLVELDLSDNKITDLPKNIFVKQTKLEKLNLDSNSIKFIHHDSFFVLPNLIKLMRNEIEGIDESFIRNLANSKKSIFIGQNKCTEHSIAHAMKDEEPDEQINSIDDEFLMEIEPCFYSYIPRNENYNGDSILPEIFDDIWLLQR